VVVFRSRDDSVARDSRTERRRGTTNARRQCRRQDGYATMIFAGLRVASLASRQPSIPNTFQRWSSLSSRPLGSVAAVGWKTAVKRTHKTTSGPNGEIPDNGIKPDVISYKAVIKACEKGGQWEKTLELFGEMEENDISLPKVISYNAAISACEKGGQWEKAVELLREMSDNGIKPDVITYAIAISACEKGGQWEKAVELLREMSGNGIKPDVISYNAAISACEKGGQWKKALELEREMSESGIWKPDNK